MTCFVEAADRRTGEHWRLVATCSSKFVSGARHAAGVDRIKSRLAGGEKTEGTE